MKIAALYDIHGNLPALNAVLEELQEIQPDLIIVGGDIISGPMPAQTLERLLEVGESIRLLSGNADREVVAAFDGQPYTRQYMPAISDNGREENLWIARQLTLEQRNVLAEMPTQLIITLDSIGDVLFCHATPRNDEELFAPETPEEWFKLFFKDVEQKRVVCGHTHIQFERMLGSLHILNASSVGMPYAEKTGAYWLLLEGDSYHWQRTEYDLEAAAQEILATDYPQAEKFVNENLLQVKTAAEATDYFEQIAVRK